MKKIIAILICLIGVYLNNEACSPGITPFQRLLDDYNHTKNIIVEGYFKPAKEGYYTSEFMVTRSSDSSIRCGQVSEIFEFGPFGSTCERYEMKGNISPDLVGDNKTRLLIAYKEKSTNGKLVTPIFWQAGLDASNNEIVTVEYDRNNNFITYVCTTNLNNIWKQIDSKEALKLQWKVKKR